MMKMKRVQSLAALCVITAAVTHSGAEVIAHWRFEEIARLDGTRGRHR
jgi:hypothetical protein